jgi:hypothetical protein
MIDWRSPPFSPIAGHYSRSRNHLPINPFLNSRNPKSPEAASHPISCTEAVVTGCGKYLRELAAGDRLLQGSGDGRLVVKLVLRLEVLADGNAAGPLVGSHFSDPRDDVVDHLCSGVEALLTTQALACEVQGDWGGRQAPSWRCWEEPSWSGVGVQGSRVCVSLRKVFEPRAQTPTNADATEWRTAREALGTARVAAGRVRGHTHAADRVRLGGSG